MNIKKGICTLIVSSQILNASEATNLAIDSSTLVSPVVLSELSAEEIVSEMTSPIEDKSITENLSREEGINKLQKIHSKLRLLHGSFEDEYPEQLMAAMYLHPDAKVLELGGNVGRNSCVIGSILQDSRNLVILESDKRSAECLQQNRDYNNLQFHIEASALSKIPLIQSDWTSKPSNVDLPGFFRVDTIIFDEVQKKYEIEFDTMVVDCEGALYYILRDDPDILKNIKLIIVENDYTDKKHLDYTLEVFVKNGFRLIFSDKHVDSPTSFREDFYQVWKK